MFFAALLSLCSLHAPDALPPIESAKTDERGRFIVNGKPFFPILLYDAPTDDDTLAMLREHGFNVLGCNPLVCGMLRTKGFYGAAHVGKKVEGLDGLLLAIGPDSPALNFKKDLFKRTAEGNAKAAALAPGRPIMNAIGYWEDEPEGVYHGKLPSQEKYDELVRAIDVSAPYLYPVPYQPIATVGDAVARARAASGGKKGLLPILQLFAWKADDRYPTPQELEAMVYLSLLEGATGIGYYSYGHVTGHKKKTIAQVQPELWKHVKGLNRKLADLAPRYLAGRPSDKAKLASYVKGVRLGAIEDASGGVAIVVNITGESMNTVVSLPDGGRRIPLQAFEARVLMWTNP